MNRAQFLISIFLRQAWCTRSKHRDGHYGRRKQRFTHDVPPELMKRSHFSLGFGEHKPLREHTQRYHGSALGHFRISARATAMSILRQKTSNSTLIRRGRPHMKSESVTTHGVRP